MSHWIHADMWVRIGLLDIPVCAYYTDLLREKPGWNLWWWGVPCVQSWCQRWEVHLLILPSHDQSDNIQAYYTLQHVALMSLWSSMGSILSQKNKNKIFFFFLNHYVPVSQANWCNMTFNAGNLFSSHSCTGVHVTHVKPQPGFKPRSPAWEADDLPTELSLPPFIFFIPFFSDNN